MKLVITAREALDKGMWDDLCDLKGINVWAINEALMDLTDEIALTKEEAQALGLLEELQRKGEDFPIGFPR